MNNESKINLLENLAESFSHFKDSSKEVKDMQSIIDSISSNLSDKEKCDLYQLLHWTFDHGVLEESMNSAGEDI